VLVDASPGRATERVLPTLNQDGTRRWIRPRLSRGPWMRRRFLVGWLLILVFVTLPHARVGGKPAILLDVAQREFTVLGHSFLASDGLVLMLALLAIFATIFLLTALVGRAWCGWACPQTVYMEFVFRPLERLIEGPPAEQRRLDREGPNARRILKFGATGLVAAFLANTFLAYFVGWDALVRWMTHSPFEHPAPFLVMLVTMTLVIIDFAWFREQACLVACPYGRFQSALLDADSLAVGYDARRGEPRGKPARAGASPSGDCIECSACVITCPTGIDIRDGLQMECIGCTQCIDACDAIMARVGKPKGLIAYTSQAKLRGAKARVFRPRLLAYAAIALVAAGALAWRVAAQSPVDVTLLRRTETPFAVVADGRVSNLVRIKVVNRSREPRAFRLGIEAPGADDAELRAPEQGASVAPGADAILPAFVIVPRSRFVAGRISARIVVTDDHGFRDAEDFVLLGP
jgi:cytochrome c oxidase accessory protein FixG